MRNHPFDRRRLIRLSIFAISSVITLIASFGGVTGKRSAASIAEQGGMPDVVLRTLDEGGVRWEVRTEPDGKCLKTVALAASDGHSLGEVVGCDLAEVSFDGATFIDKSPRPAFQLIAGFVNISPDAPISDLRAVIFGVTPCDCKIRGWGGIALISEDTPASGLFFMRSSVPLAIHRLEAVDGNGTTLAEYTFPARALQVLSGKPPNELG